MVVNSSCPGTLTSDPVNSDAFHPADAGRNDVFPPGLVTFGPRYSVQAHVCPVHCVITCKIYNGVNDKRKWEDECGCREGIYVFMPSNKAAPESSFYCGTAHFTKCCVGL